MEKNSFAIILVLFFTLAGCALAGGETVVEPISLAIELSPTAEITTLPSVSAREATILLEGTQGGSETDIGIRLIQTRDGGYVLLGYSSSFGAGGEDMYLLRLDVDGELLWSQTYGGEGTDNGWDLLETDDGGFAILGFSDSFSAGDMDLYLVRTDANGEELCSETYGGPEDEFGWAMVASPDGGFALVGQTLSFGEGGNDGLLLKVDSEGREDWIGTYGGNDRDRLFSVTTADDGGYVMAGITRSSGAGSRDAYIVKTNSLGESEWELVIGDAQDDVAHAIEQTEDGDYIITGYTQNYGARVYDTLLIKVSAAGEQEWMSVFGGEADDRTISGAQSSDGGYILTGYTRSFGAISWDAHLVKTDAAGELLWSQIFGGNSDDGGYTAIQTQEGNYMLVGHSYSAGEGRGDLYYVLVEGP